MTSVTSERPRRQRLQAADWFHDRTTAIAEATRPHLPLYVVAILSYCAGLYLNGHFESVLDLSFTSLLSTNMLVLLAAAVILWLLADLLRLWWSRYPGSPTVALLRRLSQDILSPARVANGVHAFAAMALFTFGFSIIKPNIPRINPFVWDRTFMELDRTVHFGHLPHELLAPLFQYPVVTLVLNTFYNAWFFVAIGFFLWQGFKGRDTLLRQQFLLAYLLCWGVGACLLATLFSSVGPAFYGRLLPGADPYAGLMSYLAEADRHYPVWALRAQDMLWNSYVTARGEIAGIAAMPSMHVGTSVLFFVCARAAGIRWLAWATGVFALVIMLGSILLAWHYAIDGYAGALVAIACWHAAGRIVRWNGLSSRPS